MVFRADRLQEGDELGRQRGFVWSDGFFSQSGCRCGHVVLPACWRVQGLLDYAAVRPFAARVST